MNAPAQLTEFWILIHRETRGPVKAIDKHGWLGALSEQEALEACRHQNETFMLDCVPFQIYPRFSPSREDTA